MSRVSISASLTVLFVLFLGSPGVAHAYLDPASGSILLQVILGGVAGAGLLIKMYWHKLLALFGVRKAENDEAEL